MLFYLVDAYYDGTDEWGVAWDDLAVGLDWGIEGGRFSRREIKIIRDYSR